MAMNWLYGAPLVDNYGWYEMRSLVFDHDTVKDILKLCQQIDPGSRLVYQDGPMNDTPQDDIPFEPNELDHLSDLEVTRIMIRVPATGAVLVDLRAGAQPTLMGMKEEDCVRIAEFMLANGQSRIRWTWPHLLPFVLPVALVASWLWFVLSADAAISLNVLTGLMLIPAVLAALTLRAKVTSPRFVGHRIRRISRRELWAERANRRANLKLAAYTLPAGAILGSVATSLFSR